MSLILDELYFGALRPDDDENANAKEIDCATQALDICEKKLRATLTKEQLDLFEAYLDREANLLSLSKSAAFQKGFAIGMQITLDSTEIANKYK